MKQYSVKEIFYTLQGEGAHAGRPAVFLRFAGCNLWTGLEKDRASATCQFCDTDFVGTDGENGGKYSVQSLAEKVASLWPGGGKPYVVCTGGEPLLQLDIEAINALHAKGFEVAVETNGTQVAPKELDWICVSPKAGSKWIQKSGHELKLVYPQATLLPEAITDTEFAHYFLQPMDGPQKIENTKAAVEYCKSHPKWRLSLQTHKILNIP